MVAAMSSETRTTDGFPNAPADWTPATGDVIATDSGLEPTDKHWDAVRALQEFYARHADGPAINVRELRDALDEKFHRQGGMRYLYRLFPGGPIAQGCKMAGLQPPAGSTDNGFGSVQ